MVAHLVVGGGRIGKIIQRLFIYLFIYTTLQCLCKGPREVNRTELYDTGLTWTTSQFTDLSGLGVNWVQIRVSPNLATR